MRRFPLLNLYLCWRKTADTGDWKLVLETAIRQCSQWIKHEPDFQMHINMSSRQFEVPAFKHHLMDLLSRYHVKPSNIMLELTESGKVKEPALLAKEFDFIRSQGIRISLDDFGTGYSSWRCCACSVQMR